MTDREAWEIIKPLVKAHVDADRDSELALAYCRISQMVDTKSHEDRQNEREAAAC